MTKHRLLFGLGALAGAAAGGAAVLRARHAAQRAGTLQRLGRAGAASGKSIVILGAGFGGMNTAAALLDRLPPESGWTVTVVDRHNYHLFTPLLYHAATGLVHPSSILYPVRSLSRAPHFNFRESTVESIDLRRKIVHLDDGPLAYDYLVVALGSVTNFFGQDAELKHALTLKTSGDSIAIRNRVIDAYERADITPDPEERRRLLTFVVVGGGATGLELVGALRGLVYTNLPRHYPHIRPEEARLLLLEATDQVLPGLPREMAQQAIQRLTELGVEIRLSTAVERVDEDGVQTKAGEYVPSRTVVWAAGVTPSPVAKGIDVRKEKGRLVVDEFLQLEGWPDVYALGDIAASPTETGKPLPPNAAVAVQQGKALAEILMARLEGRRPRPFVYHHRGELVSLGRNEALAEVQGVRLNGFAAWLVWRAFYLSQLMGFKNQLSVALDWTFAYVYQRDTVRLDVPPEAVSESEVAPVK